MSPSNKIGATFVLVCPIKFISVDENASLVSSYVQPLVLWGAMMIIHTVQTIVALAIYICKLMSHWFPYRAIYMWRWKRRDRWLTHWRKHKLTWSKLHHLLPSCCDGLFAGDKRSKSNSLCLKLDHAHPLGKRKKESDGIWGVSYSEADSNREKSSQWCSEKTEQYTSWQI